MIIFWPELVVFIIKNANFFGENIFKIITLRLDWAKIRQWGKTISTFKRKMYSYLFSSHELL
jgi:hypothetical protein